MGPDPSLPYLEKRLRPPSDDDVSNFVPIAITAAKFLAC
jgi:hypothetical protein